MQNDASSSAQSRARLFWLGSLECLCGIILMPLIGYGLTWAFWISLGLAVLGMLMMVTFGFQLHRMGLRPTISINTKPLR